MKTRIHHTAIACLLLCGIVSTVSAEIVSEDAARVVAENYLEAIVTIHGDWGGEQNARVASMSPLTHDGRVLGYFFGVQPRGFILVSLCRELTPVKAYSTQATPNPADEGGLMGMLKTRMLDTLEYVESQTGGPIGDLTPRDWDGFVETDYGPAWAVLTDVRFDAVQHFHRRASRSIGMDYQEGETLLTSRWHQAPPYNDDCPDEGCEWPNFNYYNNNTWVGCVATAGAQILRYWSWPPCNSAGEYIDAYRWTNMPGEINIYGPQDQIDCVAAASRSVANSVGMDFGCGGSSASTWDMEQVFQNRRYDNECDVQDRTEYTDSEWFDLLCDEFNVNRPVQYRVEGHSIVGDGWQIIDIGGVPTKQFHFIYGWYDSHDTWYDIDDIHLGGPGIEYVVREIYPEVALGYNLYGHHAPPTDPGVHFDKPARYFDVDTSAIYAEFDAGQSFQYLRPGLHILQLNGDPDVHFILFNGEPAMPTEFYHGAPFGDVRIRITDGAIKLKNGGEMCLH